MKIYFSYALLILASVVITSCGGKLKPLSSSLFKATPSPMEVVGTKVPVTVTGQFPAKWFNKNAVVTITPVLRYHGGEAYGKAQTYQGEKVAGNGITVPQNIGANFSIRCEFDYVPEMQVSELFLQFKASIGNKSFDLPEIKVADGIAGVAALASAASSTPAMAPDGFQKIIKEAHDANIMFLIQQAELRANQLNSPEVTAWKQFIKDVYADKTKNLDIEISAYASPDGGYELNKNLSEKRERNTNEYLNKELKKENINADVNARYTAQDWEGFKKLVEASNLQDKDLILRVISLYQDPETREREIKNISAVYSELAETILPQLRRSRLIANVEIIGKSDVELLSYINNNKMSELTIEELLYTANLNSAPSEKIFVYVTEKFPKDYRGWNNLGAYYYANGNASKATQAFDKAISISSKAAEPNMNLALNALKVNDFTKAEQYLGNASQANTINETLGLLYLKKGDYNAALNSFGDVKSNNAAIAHILTKNYSKAQQTLDAIAKKDAVTYYLSAIVAARTNNATGVATNLNKAMQLDSSMKPYAKSDIEFAKFLSNASVASLLR